MKNTTKGVIAGVAGLALLTGGATFALWSDSATIAGGTITNGELEVVTVDPMVWRDVSDDRSDSPHVIDPTTWRMVPGDIAQGTQYLTVTLVGDNLVANLSVNTTTADLPDDVALTYRLLDGTEEIGVGELGDDLTVRFAASTSSQDVDGDTVILDAGGRKTLTVELTLTFDEAAEDSMEDASVLNTLAINLEQDRSGAGFE